MQNNPAVVIDLQNRESEVVWSSILNLIKSSVEVGEDIGVEGVAILPHNLTAELPFEYKAVFIVNLCDQTEAILRHAHENKYDWLHKYDDKTIKIFCAYNIELNKYFYSEARKYNLPTIIVGRDFRQSIDKAVKILVS